MATLKDTYEVNPELRLGTGDDELVEKFVQTTKSTLGVAGNFIPNESLLKNDAAKKKQKERQDTTKVKFLAQNREDVYSKLIDDEGLPLVYSNDGLQQYWSGRSGELVQRWTQFLTLASPFLLQVVRNAAFGTFE